MAKIGLQDVKKAVDLCKDFLPLVEPVFKQFGPEVARQAAKAAKQVNDAAKDAHDTLKDKMRQHKDDKETRKALDEAKKRAVAGSLHPVTAEEFFKRFEASADDPEDLKNGYLSIPGCYAIITMRFVHEKDLSRYKDVYVGCSDAIGLSVYSQLRGLGNVDVYADFKFKQPMWILVYPCDRDQIEARLTSLIRDLQSVASYNKRDVMDATDDNKQ